MKMADIRRLLRAGLMAWAMFMDLNLRSGDNYVNISQSLVGTSGAMAMAALMSFLALRWADGRLKKAGWRTKLCALFLGAWQVVALSVANTNALNQPFLSSSQWLKSAVLALGMASLFELLFRLLEAGLDGSLDLSIAKEGTLVKAYRAHTLLLCMAAVLLFWLPHLIVSYPASMNSDTQSQFDQILGALPWSKHHPTLLALFLMGAMKLGQALGSGNLGLFAYVLAQAVFAAAAIGYSQLIMRRLRAPVWLRALALALCAVAPVYSDNITVILKDMPYSYAMLLLLCELVRARFLEKEDYVRSAGFMLRVILSAFLMLRMRPNGAIVWLPICAALFWGAQRRKPDGQQDRPVYFLGGQRRRSQRLLAVGGGLRPDRFGAAYDFPDFRSLADNPRVLRAQAAARRAGALHDGDHGADRRPDGKRAADGDAAHQPDVHVCARAAFGHEPRDCGKVRKKRSS